mgnify:FL=1
MDAQTWGRDTIYVAGYDFASTTGHLITSKNGGGIWTDLTLPNGAPELFAICFTDKNNGYVGGQTGTLYKTTNAKIACI